jgi:hypothetical protein
VTGFLSPDLQIAVSSRVAMIIGRSSMIGDGIGTSPSG